MLRTVHERHKKHEKYQP